MIRPEKLPNALYALNGVLTSARLMAYEGAPHSQLAELLDVAEMLPRFIAGEADSTERFREYLQDIVMRHKCAYILDRFDQPAPATW